MARYTLSNEGSEGSGKQYEEQESNSLEKVASWMRERSLDVVAPDAIMHPKFGRCYE